MRALNEIVGMERSDKCVTNEGNRINESKYEGNEGNGGKKDGGKKGRKEGFLLSHRFLCLG